MNIKKVLLWCILLLVNVSIMASCDKKSEEVKLNIVTTNKDELFDLKLYVDKDTYTKDEIINCYATLEYVGDADSITVYSSDPLVGFGLKDDKYFDGGYAKDDILIQTTFTKGEIITYNFIKSGGWTLEDPYADFYEEFYHDKNLILPIGEYEISAVIDCSLDQEDILGSQYQNKVTTRIEGNK